MFLFNILPLSKIFIQDKGIKYSQEISKEEIADKNPYKRVNILRRLSDSKKLNNNSSINTDNEKNYYKKNIKI